MVDFLKILTVLYLMVHGVPQTSPYNNHTMDFFSVKVYTLSTTVRDGIAKLNVQPKCLKYLLQLRAQTLE